MFTAPMSTIRVAWPRWFFTPYKQIKATGGMKLFRSHNPDFRDGEQLRDFIYVKDVVDVIIFMMEQRPESGLL